MKIVSILENQEIEKRIAITPEIAKKYISLGLEVYLPENYGTHLGTNDEEYKQLGVLILKDEKEIINNANIIVQLGLIDNDKISLEKYDNYDSKLKHSIQILNDIKSNPSKSVIDNDFLMQIKSKIYIPAGDNFFDMPSYLNFLTSNKSYILKNIENWYSPFIPLFKSSKLILDIRRLSKFSTFASNKSFFQYSN